MRGLRCFLSLLCTLEVSANAISADADFTKILEPLWYQADKDASGELSFEELEDACARLGIGAEIFTAPQHGQMYTLLFADLDTDSSLGISTDEFMSAATRYPEYEEPLIQAFTNGAGEAPNDVSEVSESMKEAAAKVVVQVKLTGSIGDIFPGTREAMKTFFADRAGVPLDAVVITFLPGSVIVNANIYVQDEAAAEAAVSALPATLADFAAVPAFDGFVVEEATYETKQREPLSFPIAGGVAAAIVILGFLWCGLAAVCASKTRKAKSAPPGGCCSAGCCSFHAVKAWASGTFLSILILGGTLGFLFTRMDGTQTVFVGLIDVLIEMRVSTNSAIQDLYADLPSSALDTIEENKDYAQYLKFAVMGPGLLAIVFLFFASTCPLASKMNKGSYCFTKFFVLLADLFLIVAFVFYTIFASAGLVVNHAPEPVASTIREIEGTCDTVTATIHQLVEDNKNALNLLESTGEDVTALRLELAEVQVLGISIDKGCNHLTDLFDEVINLFLPGVMCCAAILFALYCNNSLCCAAGCCCKKPPKTGSTQPAKDNMIAV